MSRKTENIKISTLAYALLSVVVIYIVIIAILIYGFGSDNWLVKKTAQYIPFPAAIVGGTHIVTVGEVENNLQAVKQFYENQDFSSIGMQVDLKTTEGQKRLKVKEKGIFNKLIENRIVEKLASDHGVVISKEMINQNVDSEVAQYDSAASLTERLHNLYGWNMDDFKDKIVKPDLYREALKNKIRVTDADAVKAKAVITQAKEALKNKEEFASVARKYSNGESAQKGGDLGWFTANQMIPEIAASAFLLEKGATSDVIESSLGFHIIKVDDKKTEDGVDKIKISQVFVKTKSFPDWLAEQEKNMNVWVFLRGYDWNKGNSSIDFKDAAMRDFENNLDKNSAGDASVLF